MIFANSMYSLSHKLILLFTLAILVISCADTERFQAPHNDGLCKNIDFSNQGRLSSYLSPYQNKMSHHTGVYVLEQGTEAMLSRAWLTEQAESTIDIQYFIFSSDNVGLIATDHLIRAADRGVKIRLLVDDIMIDAKGDELLKLSAHSNLSIKIYNPNVNIGKNLFQKLVTLTTDFDALNQRMHNKTFIVDGHVAITGGRNVADEYFGYDHKYNFRDRDALLIGGITPQLSASFEQYWQSELSVDVVDLVKDKSNIKTPDYDKLHQYACDVENFAPSVRKQIQNLPKVFEEISTSSEFFWLNNVEYIADLPGKNSSNKFLSGGGVTTDRLINEVKKAKHSVIIQTPYLVTTDLSKNLFSSLIKRGVEVKILTNSLASNDNYEAFSGYQRDRKALLATGVEIFEFKPDALIRQKIMAEVMETQLTSSPIFGLHAKSMVIDGETTIIGTFNLDPRSANLNTESLVVIPSKALAKNVEKGMKEEMAPENAWQVTNEWNPDGEVSISRQLKVKLRRVVPKAIL